MVIIVCHLIYISSESQLIHHDSHFYRQWDICRFWLSHCDSVWILNIISLLAYVFTLLRAEFWENWMTEVFSKHLKMWKFKIEQRMSRRRWRQEKINFGNFNDIKLNIRVYSQLVGKFPAFYGPRKFITASTRACQLHPFWARWIQSRPSHPISRRSILILSFHLRLGI